MIATAVHAAAKVLNDDTVSPGVLGFAVVVVLGVAVYFLLLSFRKHIARVPATFDPPASPPDTQSPVSDPKGATESGQSSPPESHTGSGSQAAPAAAQESARAQRDAGEDSPNGSSPD